MYKSSLDVVRDRQERQDNFYTLPTLADTIVSNFFVRNEKD